VASRSRGFPAVNRLRKPSEFQKVFESGIRSTDSQFIVLAARNGSDRARLGLAVSRRRQPSAVARNHIKRIVRESFCRHRQLLAGLDIVVMAQKGTRIDDNEGLRRSLARHWERMAP